MWPTSKDGGNRLWPYTFDNGIPQVCGTVLVGFLGTEHAVVCWHLGAAVVGRAAGAQPQQVCSQAA